MEGQPITKKGGYMVSLAGAETQEKNIEKVLEIVEDYKKQIANKKGLYVGIWEEKGLYYIDISKHIKNKYNAIKEGKKNKQIAIYNIKNSKSIYLDDFIKYYTLYEVIRNAEGQEKDLQVVGTFDKRAEVQKYNNNSNYKIIIDYINKYELEKGCY